MLVRARSFPKSQALGNGWQDHLRRVEIGQGDEGHAIWRLIRREGARHL
jgi:hypothetical protein